MSALPSFGRKGEEKTHSKLAFPNARTDTRGPPDPDVELSGTIFKPQPFGVAEVDGPCTTSKTWLTESGPLASSPDSS